MEGNRGEWAEIYTALKLLAEGKLYMANSLGKKNLNEYMKILDLIRNETKVRIVKYNLDPNTTDVCIDVNNQHIKAIPVKEFEAMAEALAQNIRDGVGNKFSLKPLLASQIKNAEFTTIKARSEDKSDIFISVIDPRTSIVRKEIGFSIKSEFAADPSTLFNYGKASAVVYKLSNMNDVLMDKINAIDTHKKILDRCKALLDNNCSPEYIGFNVPPQIGYPVFQENLDLLNPRLPKVIETLLYNHFFKRIKGRYLDEMVVPLIEQNPCNVRDPKNKYVFMLKNFVYAAYCGLTATTPWDGRSDVNGGLIHVNSVGDIVAYYAMESDNFKNYLFNHCLIDYPDTKPSKGDYGYIYKNGNDYFFKLNFQIRYE